jgi:hypothetical protein
MNIVPRALLAATVIAATAGHVILTGMAAGVLNALLPPDPSLPALTALFWRAPLALQISTVVPGLLVTGVISTRQKADTAVLAAVLQFGWLLSCSMWQAAAWLAPFTIDIHFID